MERYIEAFPVVLISARDDLAIRSRVRDVPFSQFKETAVQYSIPSP